mmetsp:Transcript_47996/g.133968  ORF Transcript_47996/g.133968 Transcript_47996/m.133968 type:complete len:870 (+) Transcript_47996:864-3473(+)
MFKVGSPLRGYTGASSVGDKQFYKIQEWMADVQEDLQGFFGMKAEGFQALAGQSVNLGGVATKGGLDVNWFSIVMQNAEMMHTVANDTNMAVFSMLFVWFWIVMHTGSFLIGSLGMLQIVLSLPVSLFIYRVIFRIWFFDTLQTLAIFVILGVGADDVFVMVDAWVQSRDEVPYGGGSDEDEEQKLASKCDDKAFPVCCATCCCAGPCACMGHDPVRADWYVRRMEYAYSRAMKAVFNTSWTTAMAFFATAVSPIMPISTFGIYAALCIIMNYVFVMTLTPATIIIQEYYMEGTHGESSGEKQSSLPNCCWCCSGPNFGPFSDTVKGWTPPPPSKPEKVPIDEESKAIEKMKVSPCSPEGFINGYLNTMELQTQGGVRWFAIGTVLALSAYGIFSCAASSQLTPPTEAEQWFPDNHIYSKALKSMDKFLSGDDDSYALFKVVYGMKGLDRSKYNIYIPAENRGETKYDSDFDLQPAAAQNAFLDACDTIRNYQCKEKGCQFGLLIRPNTTTCFLEEFQTWHYNTYAETTYDCTATEFYSRLTTFRETTAPKADPYGDWSTEIGMIDGELKFATIDSRMTMKVLQSVIVKRPISKIADNLVDDLVTTSTLNKPFQWTWDWVWYVSLSLFLSFSLPAEHAQNALAQEHSPSNEAAPQNNPSPWRYCLAPYRDSTRRYETEEGLIIGLMLGMAIALPVAFATLIFATGNVVVSLYAIVSIGFVVASVLGACKAYLDWDLGIAESVAGVIVIGLAVDYTIHMGHMYDHASHEIGAQDREARFRFAVEKMGTTVFAGAITTAGSGMFLYFTVLLFFSKMATLIVFTIFFSFLYSFGFFMALLLLAGPEGEFGRIGYILESLGLRKKVILPYPTH